MRTEPLSRWIYEEGVLVVQHLGKSVSLGKYASHAHAAKAAAAYFANNGGRAESATIKVVRDAT